MWHCIVQVPRSQRKSRSLRSEPANTAGSPVGMAIGYQARGLGFGNSEEDGLVRGAGFVMIWTFLVSRGYSAADCL